MVSCEGIPCGNSKKVRNHSFRECPNSSMSMKPSAPQMVAHTAITMTSSSSRTSSRLLHRENCSTLRRACRHFSQRNRKKKLREITYGDLRTYRERRFKVFTQYKRQRTVASWDREAAVLRRVLNIAFQQGWILKNPFHCGDPLLIISAERR